MLAGACWYGLHAGWFIRTAPSRLPTAGELERMAEIDRSSARIAPNAIPGAGVRPKGSLPPRTEPVNETTTTTASTIATSSLP